MHKKLIILLSIFLILFTSQNSYSKKIERPHNSKDLIKLTNPKPEEETQYNAINSLLADIHWPSQDVDPSIKTIQIKLDPNFYNQHKGLEGPATLIAWDEKISQWILLVPEKFTSGSTTLNYKIPAGVTRIKAFHWEDDRSSIMKEIKVIKVDDSQMTAELKKDN